VGLLYELRPAPLARLRRRRVPTRTGFGADWTCEGALAKATLEAYERFVIDGAGASTSSSWTLEALPEPALWLQRTTSPSGRCGMTWCSTDGVAAGPSTTSNTEWVLASGLDGSRTYLPAALVYRGAASNDDQIVFQPSGSALGFARAEALLRGLLEVVERDAISRWWHGLTQPRYVPPDAINNEVEQFIDGQRAAGRRVELRDVTRWDSARVVVAWLSEPRQQPVLGLGCALTLAAAVDSAILELAQAACFASQQRGLWPLDPGDTARLLLVHEMFDSRTFGQQTLVTTRAPMAAVETIANDLGDRVLVHDLPVNMEGIYGVKIIVPSLWGLEGPIPDAVPTRPRLPG
jgi:ribosomal protein S12 methylthiotransferase accessory factor YcaO